MGLLYFSKFIFVDNVDVSHNQLFNQLNCVFVIRWHEVCCQCFITLLVLLIEKSYLYRSFIVIALQYVWADGSAFVF